jgi:hypothetical protein
LAGAAGASSRTISGREFALWLDAAGGHFRFTDEGSTFLDNEAGGLQVALERAARLQLAALADSDVALHFAEHVIDLVLISPRMSAFSADRQDTFGVDFALHFAVDEKFFLEFDRAFDFNVAREDVLARMFSHSFLVIGGWW